MILLLVNDSQHNKHYFLVLSFLSYTISSFKVCFCRGYHNNTHIRVFIKMLDNGGIFKFTTKITEELLRSQNVSRWPFSFKSPLTVQFMLRTVDISSRKWKHDASSSCYICNKFIKINNLSCTQISNLMKPTKHFLTVLPAIKTSHGLYMKNVYTINSF